MYQKQRTIKLKDMKTVLIPYTEKRELTLISIKQKFERVGDKLAVQTNYDRDFLTEILDSL